MATSIPRWKTAITDALLRHKESVVIQLASVDPKHDIPTPHVRSHIFRAFLSASSMPSLPLIVTTTDIRTPKVTQITSNSHVELVWWIEGTQEQYRISGFASVIPHPAHPLYRHFLYNIDNAPKASGLTSLTREDFEWEEKRQRNIQSAKRAYES